MVFYRNQTSQLDQPQNEDETNREIPIANSELRTTTENQNFKRIKRNYQQKQPPTTESTRRRGNVECRGQHTISHRLNYYIYKQTLIDFSLTFAATSDII